MQLIFVGFSYMFTDGTTCIIEPVNRNVFLNNCYEILKFCVKLVRKV